MSVPAVCYWDGAYDVHDLPHGDGIMTLFNREGNAFAVEQQTMVHGVEVIVSRWGTPLQRVQKRLAQPTVVHKVHQCLTRRVGHLQVDERVARWSLHDMEKKRRRQQSTSSSSPLGRRRLDIDPASKHGQYVNMASAVPPTVHSAEQASQGDSDCDLVQDNDQGAKAKVSRRDDPARPPSRLEGALPLASTLALPRAEADRCQVPPQAWHPGMPLSTPDSDQERGAVHATSVRPTLVVPAAPPARERQGLGTAECRITIEELRPYFHLSLSVAAEVLGHW